MKLEFSGKIIGKNPQMSNFMKFHPVRAELFHTDGQTDGHDQDEAQAFIFFFCVQLHLPNRV